MENLLVSDLSGLHINEAEYLARELGVEKQYKKMTETGEMNFKQIEKYLILLNGKQESWVAEQIKKEEPFAGSMETINYLKEKDFAIYIVTDDALMSLPECNHIVRKKLGADRIIPTAEIEIIGGKISGMLRNKRTKPKILEELIVQYNPSSVLCMVQGLNDYEMAVAARKNGATVISVNSHSEKLKKTSDYHIPSISEAPGLLESIFAGK